MKTPYNFKINDENCETLLKKERWNFDNYKEVLSNSIKDWIHLNKRRGNLEKTNQFLKWEEFINGKS